MNWPSHIAYPYIIANIVAYLLGVPLTMGQEILLILFSVLPDFDYLLNWGYRTITGMRFHAGVNHHEWASHWPISYIPLALLFISIPNTYTALMLFGVISHLVMDTIACSWGVMWLYPFKRTWFNYFATSFRHINDGLVWLKQWKKTMYYRVEIGALGLVAAHLLLFV